MAVPGLEPGLPAASWYSGRAAVTPRGRRWPVLPATAVQKDSPVNDTRRRNCIGYLRRDGSTAPTSAGLSDLSQVSGSMPVCDVGSCATNYFAAAVGSSWCIQARKSAARSLGVEPGPPTSIAEGLGASLMAGPPGLPPGW